MVFKKPAEQAIKKIVRGLFGGNFLNIACNIVQIWYYIYIELRQTSSKELL